MAGGIRDPDQVPPGIERDVLAEVVPQLLEGFLVAGLIQELSDGHDPVGECLVDRVREALTQLDPHGRGDQGQDDPENGREPRGQSHPNRPRAHHSDSTRRT